MCVCVYVWHLPGYLCEIVFEEQRVKRLIANRTSRVLYTYTTHTHTYSHIRFTAFRPREISVRIFTAGDEKRDFFDQTHIGLCKIFVGTVGAQRHFPRRIASCRRNPRSISVFRTSADNKSNDHRGSNVAVTPSYAVKSALRADRLLPLPPLPPYPHPRC